MNVKNFFDKDTSTLSYVVFDKITKDCLVIDPVLNFDLEESTFSTKSIDQVYKFIKKNKFNLHMIMETHENADHLLVTETGFAKVFRSPRGFTLA